LRIEEKEMNMTTHPYPPELVADALRRIAILRRAAKILAYGH
jgi:hypothetical protein